MTWSTLFFFNSILFGIGLAMDAFSVSLANGLRQTNMGRRRMCLIAGTFAVFQIIMPLIGWIAVHTVAEKFQAVQKYIPWIALILLVWIGGGMIREGLQHRDGDDAPPPVGLRGLLVQGIATSIDALSVGFTIAEYTWPFALVEALIIGAVTFGICMLGLRLGKRFGTLLAGKASILGGLILIAIGIEILLKSLLG
ncbi:MAG: manganese efflux pump [Oscillospiraceae bacterium]|nr:manganese efflux pump [Oscillospiraceae bacterium]